MRRCLAAAVLLVALWPGAAGAAERWRPDVAGAAAWAAARQGTVTFAVRTEGRLMGRGLDRQVPAASVFKAMLLVTYLGAARDRPLGSGDRALLAPMVRASDNFTATRVRNLVGNAAVVRLARRAGMSRFAIHPVWGLSLVTARDQARFFLHVDRFMPRRHRAYGMRLLRTIVPSQRWGLAQAVPAGWRLHFKGGWGSGSGAVDHQVGLLRRGRHRVAIAVMTLNNPSHAYGKETLRGMGRRLLGGLAPRVTGTAGPSDAAIDEPRH